MPNWSRPDVRTGFDYVADTKPQNVLTGETWFDTGTKDAFVFVDETGTTQQIDVADHGQLSGVTAAAHHTRYSDVEAAAAAPVQSVDGKTGDVSVDVPVTSVEGRTGDVSIDHSDLSGVDPSDHHARPTSTQASGATLSYVRESATLVSSTAGVDGSDATDGDLGTYEFLIAEDGEQITVSVPADVDRLAVAYELASGSSGIQVQWTQSQEAGGQTQTVDLDEPPESGPEYRRVPVDSVASDVVVGGANQAQYRVSDIAFDVQTVDNHTHSI